MPSKMKCVKIYTKIINLGHGLLWLKLLTKMSWRQQKMWGGDNFQNTLFMCLKLSACKTDKAVISSNTYMKSSQGLNWTNNFLIQKSFEY